MVAFYNHNDDGENLEIMPNCAVIFCNLGGVKGTKTSVV